VDKVRWNHTETDLRNLVTGYVLRETKPRAALFATKHGLNPFANEGELVRAIYEHSVAFARTLSPGLAARLLEHEATTHDAIRHVSLDRRRAISLLRDILDGRTRRSTPRGRRADERAFDEWMRGRKGNAREP